jgi:hypothetical protein
MPVSNNHESQKDIITQDNYTQRMSMQEGEKVTLKNSSLQNEEKKTEIEILIDD